MTPEELGVTGHSGQGLRESRRGCGFRCRAAPSTSASRRASRRGPSGMTAREFFARAMELDEGPEPFALATVVVRRSPVSSHLGDRAIVRADGTTEGFVGGACSREVVCRHALDAMRTGRGRLLQIRSDPTADVPHDPQVANVSLRGLPALAGYAPMTTTPRV